MMKTIRFGKKEDSNVIDIADVIEKRGKIYCYEFGRELRFLFKDNNGYHWFGLEIDIIRGGTHASFRNALDYCNIESIKVMIFDSQCEVLKYARTS